MTGRSEGEAKQGEAQRQRQRQMDRETHTHRQTHTDRHRHTHTHSLMSACVCVHARTPKTTESNKASEMHTHANPISSHVVKVWALVRAHDGGKRLRREVTGVWQLSQNSNGLPNVL